MKFPLSKNRLGCLLRGAVTPLLGLLLLLQLPTAASTPTCKNDAQKKPPCGGGGGGCDDDESAEDSSGSEPCDESSNGGGNFFNFYSGNVSRKVKDLQLFNGAGENFLTFYRQFSSRASSAPYHFGAGNVWRHAFQWELTDDINGWIKIIGPDGDAIFFVRTTGTPNTWRPHRQGGTYRIYQVGSIYTLRTVNGWNYEFERISGPNGFFYRLNKMTDPASRVFPYTYDTSGRLQRVSEPSGRFIELAWTTAPVTGNSVISSVSSSDGRSVSYVYENMTKPSTPNHTVLTKAQYAGGAQALYTYQYEPARTGIQPYLVVCDDPRIIGKASRIRYQFYSQFFGLIVKELNPDDNSLLAERIENGDTITVQYAGGGVQSWLAPANSGGLSPSYTDRSGRTTTATYAAGKVATRTSPSGLIESYTYDSIGRIIRTTGSDGLITENTFDAQGRVLTSRRISSGLPTRLTTHIRNAQGLITRTNHPDSSFETWTYNTFGQALTHRLKNGASESWQYDATARKTQHTDATGAISTWTYYNAGDPTGSPEGLVKTSTDPRGRTTTYEYTERGLLKKTTQPDGSWSETVYDDYGNGIATLDSAGTLQQATFGNFKLALTRTDGLNRVTNFLYGSNGTACGCATRDSPTLVIRPDGTRIKRTYDADDRLLSETIGEGLPAAQTTLRTYDAAGRLSTVTDPNQVTTSFGYDARNRVVTTIRDTGGLALTTTRTFDPFGNPLSETLPSDAGTLRTTAMTYDLMDRVISSTDSLGNVTQRTFDLGGRVTSFTRAFGTPLAQTITYTYDNENRRQVTTHPDASTTAITYHPDGEMATRRDELNRTWSYDSTLVTWSDSTSTAYTSFQQTVTDPLNQITTTYPQPAAWRSGTSRIVSAAGRVSETVFDAAGQPTLTRVAPGTADATVSAYTYDLLGRRITSTVDPTGLAQTSTLTYDAIGRVTSSKDPLNRITATSYAMAITGDSLDARTRQRITRTQPDSRQEVTRLDSLGRTIVETDPKNQSTRHTFWFETTTSLSLQDPKNQITNWTYNSLGQNLSKVYANGNTHAYTYDALLRMKTHQTPKNEICTYSYDLRDRQTLAAWNTTTPSSAKTYFVNGLLKSIDNGTSKSDFLYNTRNELTSETQTLAARPARTVSYSYDADGLRTGLSYPSSRIVDLAWTARAQLLSVSADGPPPLGIYSYDKAGRLTSLAHENGITELKSYNAANELLANSHFKNGSATSGHGYTYDATGRRSAETFADGLTAARSYGYDSADQVTSATYGTNLADSYLYDAMGNRLNATVASLGGSPITYTANSANQYLSITGFTPISHDANGNLLLQNNVSYTWDSENRLLAVTPNTPALGEKSLVHSYDGLHRRVTRSIREWTASGWSTLETLHFIYDGWNVIEEYSLNASNAVLVRNLTWGQDLGGVTSLQGAGGVGGLIMVEELNGPTTAYHFHYDGNGNVTEVTGNTGSKAASYRYDAFGNTQVASGPYAAQNRYRFSTKPLDSEVTNAPLYYYGYRYYDPTTGRWLSRDPFEEKGGINLYEITGNDSVNDLDYLGLTSGIRKEPKTVTVTCSQSYSCTPSKKDCPCPQSGSKTGTSTEQYSDPPLALGPNNSKDQAKDKATQSATAKAAAAAAGACGDDLNKCFPKLLGPPLCN